MIEGFAGNVLIGYISPVALFTAAICMLVLRAGASRVFFDIVGTFQASKLINDARSAGTVFESIYLDAISGVQEAAGELGDIFNAVTDNIVPIARELEEAQIQLEKFLDEAQDMDAVASSVADIGIQFGFAADEAFDAAAKMAQISGVLGPGSLAVGTEIGMQFGLISGMETEAAMQRMINLQQQTKFMTENLNDNMTAEQRANQIRKDSIVILDELNTIENRSAATMEQITFVMNQFASQAHLANEEIKSMAALSAVMIETGEEQGKGGRALKMMYARLGSDIGGARTEMERLGVAVTDANGDMRPLSNMLKELEEGFNELSGAEQQNTAQIIAGNRHYTRFLKLMTNLDRVRQLEIEASLAMFPAMEEINRRRESELFLLEQSEARVRNLSGALGEQLLPAMTEISNKQAIFLETIIALNEGPLGGMITSMMALSKSATVLLGPILNTIINFKNMSIAFQTHAAITRALDQQQDMVNKGFVMGGAALNEYSTNIKAAARFTEGLRDAQNDLINPFEENIHLMGMSSKELAEQAVLLDEAAENARDFAEAKRLATQAEEARVHAGHKFVEEQRAAELADRNAMEQAKRSAQAMNGVTMALGGAGSAMIMFGNNQRTVRTGMILNAAAMGAQIVLMIKKNALSVVEFTREKMKQIQQTKGIVLDKMVATLEVANLRTKYQKLSLTLAQTDAERIHTAVTIGLGNAFYYTGTAMIRLVKIAAPLMAFFAASMLIGEAAEKMGLFATKTDEAAQATSVLTPNMTDVITILDDEAMSLDAINKQLKDKEDLQQRLIDSGLEINRIAAEGMNQEISNLTAAKEVAEFREFGMNLDKSATDKYFSALKEEERLLDKFGEGGVKFNRKTGFGLGQIGSRMLENLGTGRTLGFATGRKTVGEQLSDQRKIMSE
jgi:TP901 family phage tail tape measure protein